MAIQEILARPITNIAESWEGHTGQEVEDFVCRKLQAANIIKMIDKIFVVLVNSDNVSKRDLYYSLNKDKRCINQLLLIEDYLKKYKPNILVITGHDAMYKRNDKTTYKNSDNFINTINEARKYEENQERLIIIAGACQSNYEELIKAGANFASSPKRVNIHALDPAIIASSIALSDRSIPINLLEIIERTKYKEEGVGGIITSGTMYKGYPR